MTDISIIISSYNNVRTIERCIGSVINNDWGKYLYQLIVVDDGSTDGTEDYLKEMENCGELDLILKESNEGTLLSRLDGANLAKGKYITFLDADDALTGKIENRLDEIFAVSPDLIEFRFNYCYEDGHRKPYENALNAGKYSHPQCFWRS